MDPLTVQLALLLVAIVAIVAMALNKDKVAEKLVDVVSLFSQHPRAKKPNQEETK